MQYQSSPKLPWMFNSSPHCCHKGLKFKIWQFGKEIQFDFGFKNLFDNFDELLFGHDIGIVHLKFPVNLYKSDVRKMSVWQKYWPVGQNKNQGFSAPDSIPSNYGNSVISQLFQVLIVNIEGNFMHFQHNVICYRHSRTPRNNYDVRFIPWKNGFGGEVRNLPIFRSICYALRLLLFGVLIWVWQPCFSDNFDCPDIRKHKFLVNTGETDT